MTLSKSVTSVVTQPNIVTISTKSKSWSLVWGINYPEHHVG